MARWILIFLATALVLVLVLRIWKHWDDRKLALVWQNLSSYATHTPGQFDKKQINSLPTTARRFFEHTIKDNTSLHKVVEISMRGEFSLGDKNNPNYLPMKACQLLAAPHGFIWDVEVGKGMMRFSGSDAAFPGGSWTRFWLYGILPIVRSGTTDDHALSSFGRYMGEAAIWSPAALMPSKYITWKEININTAAVTIEHNEFVLNLELTISDEGKLERLKFQRWTNANTEKIYRLQPFGGYLSDFKYFDGFLLPTTIIAGNYFDTEDYFPFFKARVDSIKFVKSPKSDRTCRIGK